MQLSANIANNYTTCRAVDSWWLTELPYWFKVTFLLKNFGILTMRGEKDLISLYPHDPLNLFYARSYSHAR